MSGSGLTRVIVTNDDGIDSEGLRLLAATAAAAGCQVLVAAPDREASGAGTAMTATVEDGRVLIERRTLPGLEVPAFAVRAAPAFIAFTAAAEAFGDKPDVLLSGINLGPNTGQAVLHSGTVGAAMTAAVHGVRAAAFSLDVRAGSGPPQWQTAAAVAARIIPVLSGLPAGQVLNVNVPNVPESGLRGIRRGDLAAFGAVQASILKATESYLQVTMSETQDRPPAGTDSALLAAGFASVTALRPVCEAPADWLDWPEAPHDDEQHARAEAPAAGRRPLRPGSAPGG